MEEIQMFLDEAKEMMDKAINHLAGALAKIRAGKANPGMLDSIKIDYYGSLTPLNQVASINTPDAHTLMVKPWEKTIIGDIEKAIMNSDLGLNPQNDGEQVIINIPTLTEERRLSLVKQVKHEGEQGKISLRNSRHEILHSLKSLKDDGVSEDEIRIGEEKIQTLIDEYGKKIDQLLAKKEEDILTV